MLLDRNITVVALTHETVAVNDHIWSEIKRSDYSVILASLEILLRSGSLFWSIIADNKPSKFKSNLACIAIDKVHLTWGWREFRKEYGNIGTL